MKFSSKIFLTILLIILFSFMVVISRVIMKTDYASVVPQIKPCSYWTAFRIDRHPASPHMANIEDVFIHHVYLDSANWCSVKSIVEGLQKIDSMPAKSIPYHQEVLSRALTYELKTILADSFSTYNPDFLISLLQWVMPFNNYQDIDSQNVRFYRVIYRYWLNYVANKLGDYAELKPAIKYEFKFKYLVGLCHSQKFTPPVGNSKTEKIINNFIEKNYAYMFNRFWNSTGIAFKLVALIMLIVQLYAFWCMIKIHLIRTN